MKTILVVDDEYSIVETLRDVLELEGYRVASASNGQEALDLMHAGERPAFVIMDVMMPVLDGLETLRRMQASGLDGVPVALMSAAPSSVVSADDRQHVALYLRKPFDLQDLLRLIDEAIGKD